MNNPLISIDGGLESGEKVIRRLDISVPLAERRKEYALMAFSVAVVFSCMLFGFLLISRVPLHFLNSAILLVVCAVSWKIFDRFLRFTFPDFSELLVTNQRLILRAGSEVTEWISDYDCEIEVFVIADIASFALRPAVLSCSPREVYVRSSSPFAEGKELADLLRSFSRNVPLSAEDAVNSISSVAGKVSSYSITGGVSVPSASNVPPGVAVTHVFLSEQLRSIIAAIPLLSFVEAESIVSQSIPAQGQASALPAEVFSDTSSASETTESPPDSDASLDLGATGYQFGVDQQP